MSIPAVGEETANVILTEVPSLNCLRMPNNWWHLQVQPQRNQIWQLHPWTNSTIQKQEMLIAFSTLSSAGDSGKDHNPVIARFYRNLIANGKVPMKAVGASMRKLLHIIFGVLKSGTPFRDDIVSA